MRPPATWHRTDHPAFRGVRLARQDRFTNQRSPAPKQRCRQQVRDRPRRSQLHLPYRELNMPPLALDGRRNGNRTCALRLLLLKYSSAIENRTIKTITIRLCQSPTASDINAAIRKMAISGSATRLLKICYEAPPGCSGQRDWDHSEPVAVPPLRRSIPPPGSRDHAK